ncbi:MAG: hypothetical protein E6G94_16235 [Alphaproteobacteria bacterium]|nr:MAG: hypothetical protein E6G94_16235 [Alphaproteobacteria bacterium]
MTPEPHPLYDLLPVIVRMRDADAGYPLRALVTLIGEQVDAVEADIDRQYANWFIETCDDWVVPYIGDLVGYRPVAATGRARSGDGAEAHMLNAAITPRAEIANILAFRRRKGTLALLEDLAFSVADWPARAVEFYTLLARTQHVNHVRPGRGRSVDVRDGDALARLGGPFERIAHNVDVRRAGGGRRHGRFNIPSIGVFAWRLGTFPVSHAPACCVEGEGSECYTFSILGNDQQLYSGPVAEQEPGAIAEEANLPVAIGRRAFETRTGRRPLKTEANASLYGAGRSVAIYAPGWPERDSVQPVPASCIIPADLTDWRHRAPRGRILVDPVRGRIVFPSRHLPRQGVSVDYRYGFSAAIGGGEYHRPLSQPAQCNIYRVSADRGGKDGLAKSINDALLLWRDDRKMPERDCPAAVIEIADSAAYTERLAIELAAGEYLQIRAADRCRPVIRLLDYMAERPDAFTVSGKAGSRLVLDGLLVAGRGIQVTGPDPDDAEALAEADLCDLTIRHCTLVPGWSITCDCEPRRPSEPSLDLVDSRASLRIEHSIIGAIHVAADEVQTDPVRIAIGDSIVDSTAPQRAAIGSSNLPRAFANVSFARCTVFGRVEVQAIPLAENSIFSGEVRVARRQLGCMRYCYVPPGSRTPRRSNCQPDLVMAPPGVDKPIEAARVTPHFNSIRYGNPAYAQLSRWCAAEIRRGADDESEMGAFHDLFQPQREANLAQRLSEYAPAATDADILFVN